MTSRIDTQLQQDLEHALLEEQLFPGTLRGDMAAGRAATLVQQLEGKRRLLRGEVNRCPERQAAWEAYLAQILRQQSSACTTPRRS